MTDKHTPTPWSMKLRDHSATVCGPGEIQVVSTSWHSSIRATYPLKPESLANANFVVRACNSHEALVEVLQEARLQIEYMQSKFEPTGSGNAVLARIHAALTAAGAPHER